MTVFHPPLGRELDAYIAALDSLIADLSPELRAEILTGIREHLQQAIDALGHQPSPAETRQLLAELGPPQLIARRAHDLEPRVQSGRLIATWVPPVVLGGQLLGMIGAAFLVPLIATIAAIGLVVTSSLWHWWEKVLSVACAIGGAYGMTEVFQVALSGMDCGADCQFTAGQITQTAIGIVLLGICALGAIYLVIRGGRRALAVESASRWGTSSPGGSLSQAS